MNLRNLLILLPAATSFLGVNKSSTPASELAYFHSEPFYIDDHVTHMKGEVNATSDSKVLIRVLIVNDLVPNGFQIFSKNFSSSDSFTINYNNAYTIGNAKNYIKIEESTGTVLKIHNSEVPTAIGKTSYITNDMTYFSDGRHVVYTPSQGFVFQSETTKFENFESPYVTDYYHKIDIGVFKLSLTKNLYDVPNLEQAQLMITNRNGAFDKFPHNASIAVFDVGIYRNVRDGSVRFKFINDLYVNQMSLAMSNVKEEGYVKTSYLYLPKNEKRFETDYDCMLVLVGYGMNRDKLVFNFTISSILNILGDCRNSEYCIVNLK